MIKNERHSGKLAIYAVKVNPEWKDRLNEFTSSQGKNNFHILDNTNNKKPFRLT
jgi:hypothetical protein